MDNVTIQSSISNETDFLCSTPLLWTQEATDDRKARLIVCIIAAFTHTIFWLQLLFSSAVRQISMQWLYAYLITDILLLFRFFFIYIVYTTSTQCEPSKAWVIFMYYFDATADNYFNVLEVYILLALNICRYIQIAYNRNVYQVYVHLLILTHLGIYIISAMSLIVQFLFGWCRLDVSVKDSCQVTYTNLYIQIFNVIASFVLPILLNILVIYLSVRHVRLTSSLQRAQHHVSAREKYNRSLVIQFLVFYIVWLALWSPNVIVYQISVDRKDLTSNVRLLSYIGIALDPIIIAALDVRFWQEWRNTFVYLKDHHCFNQRHVRRIHHSAIHPNGISVKTRPVQATGF